MKRKITKKPSSKFTNKPSFKWVICDKCMVEEVKVSEESIGAVCSICVQKMVQPPVFSSATPQSTGRPRGWQFMKLFVGKDGSVYHKGVEQPKLKGTLPPTEIKKNGEKKKSAFERNQEQLAKESKLANKYKKKQDKKNGKNSNGRRRAKKTK